MTRQPRRKRRLAGAGALGALAVLALILLRCSGQLGLGGGGEPGADAVDAALATDASEPLVHDAAQTQLIPSDARSARCDLRLDKAGLTLGGEPIDIDAAVTACAAVGSADLTVTGDAAFGTAESLRQALDAAGVEVYER